MATDAIQAPAPEAAPAEVESPTRKRKRGDDDGGATGVETREAAVTTEEKSVDTQAVEEPSASKRPRVMEQDDDDTDDDDDDDDDSDADDDTRALDYESLVNRNSVAAAPSSSSSAAAASAGSSSDSKGARDTKGFSLIMDYPAVFKTVLEMVKKMPSAAVLEFSFTVDGMTIQCMNSSLTATMMSDWPAKTFTDYKFHEDPDREVVVFANVQCVYESLSVLPMDKGVLEIKSDANDMNSALSGSGRCIPGMTFTIIGDHIRKDAYITAISYESECDFPQPVFNHKYVIDAKLLNTGLGKLDTEQTVFHIHDDQLNVLGMKDNRLVTNTKIQMTNSSGNINANWAISSGHLKPLRKVTSGSVELMVSNGKGALVWVVQHTADIRTVLIMSTLETNDSADA